MNVEVRKYQNGDFERVNELLNEAFGQCKPREYNDECFTEIVCLCDGVIVGYLIITKILNTLKDKYIYHVDNVCVDSNYRGLGIAPKMMEFVDKKAKEEDILYIELTSKRVRVAAHKLYEKCGYEIRESDIFRKVIV